MSEKTVLLLPQMREDSDISSDVPGKWNEQQSTAFHNVATSLEYNAPGAIKNISSVPTMWARPLTFEMVLYDRRHSMRSQFIDQWQGMLAAVALAEMRGLPLTAKLVELGSDKLQGVSFGKSLFDLKPNYGERNLYTLQNKHPWQDLYVFLYEVEIDNVRHKRPVGMTSPTTLVVPSAEADWGKLPWWNRELQRLQAPQAFLNAEEQALLWMWLRNLSQQLGQYGGNDTALNTITGLIVDFQRSLAQNQELQPEECFSTNEQFFGIPINRGALIALNKPVKAPPEPSSVALIPSRVKTGKQLPLLLYDPEEMPKVWGVEPQNIWLHEGQTLASLKPGQFAHFKERWVKEVNLVKKDDLFFPELYFIELEDGLPGALLPDKKKNDVIRFNNKPVTPLIPLNSMLVDYFTPEELVEKITFKMQNNGKVRLILNLPLSGVKQKQQSYPLYKEYDLKEENCLGEQLPVVQIWPNFRTEGWQEYYTFYYDSELGAKAFQITIPEAKDSYDFNVGFGKYQLSKSPAFPEVFPCTDGQGNLIGMILMKSPTDINKNRDWKVGVDFGTSFTNIFIKLKDSPEPLPLKNLQRQITKAAPDTILNALFEFFIPENFIPQDKPLPISSVLTTNGKNPNHEVKLPIFDGRMYIPNNKTFKPQEEHIKTNLKWQKGNTEYYQLFISHLALHISALAAESGVKSIQWAISYPSAFSHAERKGYVSSWKKILTDLGKTTGITHKYPTPNDSKHLKTESLASAQYFADYERQDLVYTTCIDMGGGTSDISIWDSQKIVHQCSVLLAGRDIFSEIVRENPSFIKNRLEDNFGGWDRLHTGAFNAKLDVWLRLESENWLKNEREQIADEEDMKGLVTVMAIGVAGLYYYVGILLKVLKQEGKHSREGITPVYIGGNGSRFLHWLDDQGNFSPASEINKILSRMLSSASGFPHSNIETVLTNRCQPKDEVACGLVLEDSRLEVRDIKEDDRLIAGEACLIIYNINQEDVPDKITANSRIKQDDELELKDFKIPELVELPKFLCEFHKVLKELNIEEIFALKDYKMSPDTKDNSELWKRTQRALEDILIKEMKGKSEEIRFEPPFILGLKALLRVLAKDWAKIKTPQK
ncbi:hypothetical protein [Aphanothece sacrum]|uniref:Uncharacterized protein n=1 Tax=Aphanothece sacrum FPU1 TaxID=1920663 RepID=A0A401IBZ2_APHSA|nr:hypothetical protein [Aphanothece sacrum]GBF78798.1 hypothetical protein AsFPU1_0188 [Aphanothece sacrum FPU1]GBF83030.1 hypothetical protein AsFPU3_0068 [Aphanothece sacrum FPU3]